MSGADGAIVPYGANSYASTDPKFLGMTFEKYVKSISRYPDGYFDLVVVDGRSRVDCISRAVKKVRPYGYLMLDNSERQEYQDAISLLTGYNRTDFFGIGPYNMYLWKTSVWEICGTSY